MPYTLTTNDSLQIIEIRYHGIVSGEDLKRAVVERVAVSESNNYHRSLADLSGLELSASLLNIHNLPEVQYEEEAMNPDTKIAIMTLHEHELAEYFAAVSRNRGWQVKTFTDRTEALEWLVAD
mgnify:CR=1 FL=1